MTNAKRVRSAPPMGRSTTQVPPADSGAEGQAENPLPDGKKKRRSVEDRVNELAKKPDRTDLLQLLQDNWEALESCRIREEELADADLPVHSLIPMRVRLSSESLAILTELRRMAAQELLKQNAVVGQSSAQAPRGEDHGENPLVNASNKASAVETVTTDPTTMLRGLALHTWEALERCRWGEELLDEKGLPTHFLAAASARLSKVMVAFLTEDQRNEDQAFFIKLVVGSEGSPPGTAVRRRQAGAEGNPAAILAQRPQVAASTLGSCTAELE